MTENEQIQVIDDLLIGFDELGFRPTIPLPDPEATAVRWRNKLVNALKDYRKVERGEWITPWVMKPYGKAYGTPYCSVCKQLDNEKGNFCRFCGADMRGNKNERQTD